MKNKLFKLIASVLTVCILLCSFPKVSYCDWRERDLPGLVSKEETTRKVLITLGGAAVVIGLVVLITKASTPKKDTKDLNKPVKENGTKIDAQDPSNIGGFNFDRSKFGSFALNTDFTKPTSLMQEIERTSQRIPVDVYIIPVSLSNTFAFQTSKGVEVGIKIRF